MKIKLPTVLSVLLFVTVSYSQTDVISNLIKNKIESANDDKPVSADGIVLFSQNVLPLFYKDNGYAPAWENEKNKKELISNLEDAYNEGLLPEDYHLKRIEELHDEIASDPDPEKKADLDLLMTDGLLLYATHLITGKVDQSLIRPGWNIPPNQLPENAENLLTAALSNDSLTATINHLKPDNFMYVLLRNGLKHYRLIAGQGGWPPIPPGETLRPGEKDSRIPVIRKYLTITGDLPSGIQSENDSVFDQQVEKAVKHFQFRHNLNQDGIIGKNTLAMMNVPVKQRIDEIRVNMERGRWVMHQLSDDFLVVNIAGFNIRRVTNDSAVFYSRVIVGKNYHETPIFKNKVRYIELNPTWTLPYSIASRETLPRLKKDPGYLAKHNMIIMNREGKVIDPNTIDFSKLTQNNFHYTIRQQPGPNNALGQVKFMFPNKYAVYLHDTPSHILFQREERAFSHGCIRLDKKWELLMNLVDEPGVWNMKKINEVVATHKTTTITLKKPIDILLLYWTAGADNQDRLFFNKDVYHRDPDVLEALNKPFIFKKAD